jgi:pimeloyl-ACP methyl ester carboxylesterase
VEADELTMMVDGDCSRSEGLHELNGISASVRGGFKFNASAAIYRLGGAVMPRLTGLLAARQFGKSRQGPQRDDGLLPIDAVQFSVGDDDVNKGYLWKADGPTVLLIHGWSSDSSSMLGLVKPMLEAGFQVATFDAPGHGTSRGARTTMARFVEAGVRVVDAIGGVDFLVGHSLGAVACAALAKHIHAEGGRVRAMSFVAAPASLNAVLDIWASARPQQLTDALRTRVREQLKRDNGVPVSHWDIVCLCCDVHAPILLVHDESDPVVPMNEAVRLQSHLDGAVPMRTVGYGHSRILLAPEVKAGIVQFLSKHNDLRGRNRIWPGKLLRKCTYA